MNTTAVLYGGPARTPRSFRITYTGSPVEIGELLAGARMWGGEIAIEDVSPAGEGKDSLTVRVTFGNGIPEFSPIPTWLSACAVRGAQITEC